MFFGYVALSANLFAMILAKSSEAPVAADSAPTYRIYDITGTVLLTGTTTAGDQTGLYYFSRAIQAADGFVQGTTYTVKFTYAVSSASKGDIGTFTVV